MTLARRLSPAHDMMFGQGLGNFATRSEACAQSVLTRLLLIRAEWFLDIDAGTPYLEEVFSNPMQLGVAEAAIKKVIAETVDVQEIVSFSLDLNHDTRVATVLASVRTVYGDITNIEVVL